MSDRLMNFFTVATYAFVPWALVLFVLTFIMDVPRIVFIAAHYLMCVLVFGFMFHFFYQTHPKSSAFMTATASLAALCIFELIFWNFFSSDTGRFLNYVDWIFPAFLITTTIYAVGKYR